MADAATATLHTPWDCRWSRFARRVTREQTGGSLWDCVHTGSRVPITEADCSSCPLWEYQPTGEGALEQAKACAHAAKDRSAPVPFTITMWLGAAMSFMAGVFGSFRSHADGTFRGFLPPRA